MSSAPARREQPAQQRQGGGERALLAGVELLRHQAREPAMSRRAVRSEDLAASGSQGDDAPASVLWIVAAGSLVVSLLSMVLHGRGSWCSTHAAERISGFSQPVNCIRLFGLYDRVNSYTKFPSSMSDVLCIDGTLDTVQIEVDGRYVM